METTFKNHTYTVDLGDQIDPQAEKARELLKTAERAGIHTEELGDLWQSEAVEIINEFADDGDRIYRTDDEELDAYLCDELNAGVASKFYILRNFDPSATWHKIDAYGWLRPVYATDLVDGLREVIEELEEEEA